MWNNMARAYYNEFDPKAAAWIRELIVAGLIAPGDVDTRSIVDVRPSDLAGYTQCHFFAGIGVWSYALRKAGWSDDRPIWTGSCPCQPFSAAGKRGGVDDERHLWPHFHWLIDQCRPDEAFGEQVASKDGLAWFDLVHSDLEGTGYTSGAVDFCAASVGAPHIRQRLYWFAQKKGLEHAARDGRFERWTEPSGRGVASGRSTINLADAIDAGSQGRLHWREDEERSGFYRYLGCDSTTGGMGHSFNFGRQSESDVLGSDGQGVGSGRRESFELSEDGTQLGGLAYTDGGDTSAEWQQRSGEHGQQPQDRSTGGLADTERIRQFGFERETACDHAGSSAFKSITRWSQRAAALDGTPTGPTNGFWQYPDWLLCRDDKWRAVESGTFPLAHGASARMVRLRGYGNAINAEAATAFIEAYLEKDQVEIESVTAAYHSRYENLLE